MKFDLIISNPPYSSPKNQMIDVKILHESADLSDNVCFVMPVSACIMKERITKRYEKFIPIFNNRLTSLIIIDPKFFNAAFSTDLGILKLSKDNNHNITYVNDLTKTSYIARDISEINKYENHPLYISIKNKTYNIIGKHVIYSHENFNKEFIGLAVHRGHTGTNDWTSIVSKNYDLHYKNNNQKNKVFFETQLECKNFYEYLKLKIVRFYNSIYKYDGGTHFMMPYMPSYEREWTDEDVANELGLTDEELKWAINWIPDYYPEDKEKYKIYK